MNKPCGYVCSAVSDSHKTVYELFPEELQKMVREPKRGDRLHSVGRLDCETSGLLLFTTDGRFSNYLTRAENRISKTYLVTLKNTVDEQLQMDYKIKALAGLVLPAEKKAPEENSLPSKIEWIDNKTARITVTEGKFHEVRRIFLALGNIVERLERIAIGNLKLDSSLSAGSYRILVPDEILQAVEK